MLTTDSPGLNEYNQENPIRTWQSILETMSCVSPSNVIMAAAADAMAITSSKYGFSTTATINWVMRKCEKRLPRIFTEKHTLECPHKHIGNMLISVISGTAALVWDHIKGLEKSNHNVRHLDSLNILHDESDSTKSEIETNFADVNADLRQHCIHRANRCCNLRTTSIDEDVS